MKDLKDLKYEVERPLPIGKNKMNRLRKDELGGRLMKESVALGYRMYSNLTDNGHIGKRAKGTTKRVIKQEIKFED